MVSTGLCIYFGTTRLIARNAKIHKVRFESRLLWQCGTLLIFVIFYRMRLEK